MKYDKNEIKRLFGYTDLLYSEIEPYCSYSKLIVEWLEKSEFTEIQFLRLLLAGFYFDFKVCYSMGIEFTTDVPYLKENDLLKQKADYYNYRYNTIKNSNDYLAKLNSSINNFNSTECFFNYVINGGKEN